MTENMYRGNTGSSACTSCGSSASPSFLNGDEYWIMSQEIYIPRPDVLTEIQRKALARTMQKHTRGFELLAE